MESWNVLECSFLQGMWRERQFRAAQGTKQEKTSGVKGDYPSWVLHDPSLTFTESLIQIPPGGLRSELIVNMSM